MVHSSEKMHKHHCDIIKAKIRKTKKMKTKCEKTNKLIDKLICNYKNLYGIDEKIILKYKNDDGKNPFNFDLTHSTMTIKNFNKLVSTYVIEKHKDIIEIFNSIVMQYYEIYNSILLTIVITNVVKLMNTKSTNDLIMSGFFTKILLEQNLLYRRKIKTLKEFYETNVSKIIMITPINFDLLLKARDEIIKKISEHKLLIQKSLVNSNLINKQDNDLFKNIRISQKEICIENKAYNENAFFML